MPIPSDIVRDELYTKRYYDGKDPQEFVREENGINAISLFDRKDLYLCLELLEAEKHLPTGQVEQLKSVIYKRAYGEYTWETWGTLGENNGTAQPDSMSEILQSIPKDRIDLAIAKATSVHARAGIRVMLARKEGKPGYINPELVPSGPVLFIKGNPLQDPEVETPFFKREVEMLLKVPEGSRTSRAALFLSDIHLKRGKDSIAHFETAITTLAKTPPQRLIIGGDIIDAPGVLGMRTRINQALRNPGDLSNPGEVFASLEKDEQDLFMSVYLSRLGSHLKGEMTSAEFLAVRRQMIIDRIDFMRKKLPNTKISLLLGNHDMPRLDGALPMRPKATSREMFGVLLELKDVPAIIIKDGLLSRQWLDTFRRGLREVLETKGASEQGLRNFDSLEDAHVLRLARMFFPIKGEKLEQLHEFFYYDENWAHQLQLDLECLGVEALNKRCDKYYEKDLGTVDTPQRALLSHQPLESGDNLNRVVREKPLVSGGQTKWPDGTRLVIAFDQHVACSVIMERDGSAVSVHQVGSFTTNSNPGQRFMCAVMDPENGNLYHLTFADEEGNLSVLSLAAYRQLQYIRPDVDPTAPLALGTSTGNMNPLETGPVTAA